MSDEDTLERAKLESMLVAIFSSSLGVDAAKEKAVAFVAKMEPEDVSEFVLRFQRSADRTIASPATPGRNNIVQDFRHSKALRRQNKLH